MGWTDDELAFSAEARKLQGQIDDASRDALEFGEMADNGLTREIRRLTRRKN